MTTKSIIITNDVSRLSFSNQLYSQNDELGMRIFNTLGLYPFGLKTTACRRKYVQKSQITPASRWMLNTGHGQHSSKFVICVVLFVIRVVLLLILMFYVLFMCKCVLPPGVNPIAVDKISISISILGLHDLDYLSDRLTFLWRHKLRSKFCQKDKFF
jgi:hypothetical protein